MPFGFARRKKDPKPDPDTYHPYPNPYAYEYPYSYPYPGPYPIPYSTGFPFTIPVRMPSPTVSWTLDDNPSRTPARRLNPDSVVPSLRAPILPPVPAPDPISQPFSSQHPNVTYSDGTPLPSHVRGVNLRQPSPTRESRPRKLRKPRPKQRERQLNRQPMSMPMPMPIHEQLEWSTIMGIPDTRSIHSVASKEDNSDVSILSMPSIQPIHDVYLRTPSHSPVSSVEQINQDIGDKGPWDREYHPRALDDNSVPRSGAHSTPSAHAVNYRDPIDRDARKLKPGISDTIQPAVAPILRHHVTPGASGRLPRQSIASTDLSEILMLGEGPVSPLFSPLRLISPESHFLRYSYASEQQPSDQQLPPPSLIHLRSRRTKAKYRYHSQVIQDAP